VVFFKAMEDLLNAVIMMLESEQYEFAAFVDDLLQSHC